MQQRTSAFGRPSGTDGSDFSYRMVVDSRYQRVAKAKSRLSALFLVQAIIQILGVFFQFLFTTWQKELLNRIAILSLAISLISLIFGEIGRRRSRVSLLKLYMVGSSIVTCLSIACVVNGNLTSEGMNLGSSVEASKYERLETSRNLLGLLFQAIAIITVVSLIRNMSPPKKTS